MSTKKARLLLRIVAMRITVIGTVLALLAPGRVLAESTWWEAGSNSPDMRFEVRVESVPSGAEVCTTPETSYDEPVVIGRTPMLLPVNVKWERIYKQHIWKAMHVEAPGGVGEADYSREEGTHTLFLDYTLRSPGYADTNVVVHLATLAKSDVVWTNLQTPPYPRVIRTPLTPKAGSGRAGAGGNIRTVMIASGSGGLRVESGTVRIYANSPFANVTVNGQAVGAPPVRLVLDAALHRIEVSQRGYRTERQDVDVASGANLTLQFNLEPE